MEAQFALSVLNAHADPAAPCFLILFRMGT